MAEDAVLLRDLRVSASLEASGYVDGAKKITDANTALTQSDIAAGETIRETDRKIATRITSMAQLTARYDEVGHAAQSLARSEAQLARDQESLTRQVERGAVTAEQAARITEGLAQRQQQLARQQQMLASASQAANITAIAAQPTNAVVAGLGRIEAGLTSAGTRIAAFSEHLTTASGSLTAMAGDNEKLARSLALTQAATSAAGTAVSGLSAILTRSPLGIVLGVVSVGVALWQSLTAAVSAFSATTQQSTGVVVDQQAAMQRWNELTGEAARQQAQLAAETDRAAEAIGRQNVETARAAATATGERLVGVQRDLASARAFLADERARQGVDDPNLSVEGRARAEALFAQGAAAQRTNAEIAQLTDREERLNAQLAEQTRVLEQAQQALDRFRQRVQELRTATGPNGLAVSVMGTTAEQLAIMQGFGRATQDAAGGQRQLNDASTEAARIFRDSLPPQEQYAETSRHLVDDVYPGLVRQVTEYARANQQSVTPLEAHTRAQEVLNRALRDADPATQAARQASERAIQQQEQDRQRIQQAWEQPFTQAARSIQKSFADAFAQIFESGRFGFESLFSAVRSAAVRLAGEIAALTIFRPIAGGALSLVGLGGVASQLGLIAPGGSGGGGGGGQSGGGGFQLPSLPIGSLLGNGSLFSNGGFLSGTGSIGTFLNNSIGTSLGFAPAGSLAPGTFGPLAAGQVYGTTLTSFLGDALPVVGAALPGLFSGNYAQAGLGAAGALAGSFIMPGIGTAIGGFLGNLVGGLFGKQKIQIPTAAGWVSPTGGVSDLWAGGGGDTSRVGALAGPYAQALASIVQAAGGTGITAGQNVNLGYDGTSTWVRYATGGQNEFHGEGQAQAAIQNALNAVAPSLQVAGIGRAAQYTLANKGATDTLDQLVQDLQAAVQWQKQYDAALADTGDTLSQAEQAVKNLNDQFDAMKAQAAQYGYGPEELEALRVKKLAKMASDYNDAVQQSILGITDPNAAALAALDKEREQAIKDATALGANLAEVERLYGLKRQQIVEQQNAQTVAAMQQQAASLKAWLDGQIFGPNSSSSPTTRFTEAQSQFAAQLAAARGGDAAAANSITTYADRLLASGGAYYGKATEQFAVLEQLTRSQVMALGRALGLEGFAGGGTTPGGPIVVGENGPEILFPPRGSTVVSNQASGDMAMVSRAGFAAMIEEIRGLRGEIARLANDNAWTRKVAMAGGRSA